MVQSPSTLFKPFSFAQVIGGNERETITGGRRSAGGRSFESPPAGLLADSFDEGEDWEMDMAAAGPLDGDDDDDDDDVLGGGSKGGGDSLEREPTAKAAVQQGGGGSRGKGGGRGRS